MRKFHLKIWGCQMNYSDAEKIAAVLEKSGFAETEDETKSDVIVLNTCSVRQRAEDKVLGLGRKMVSLKKANPDLIVVLTGCMAQRIRRDCKETKVNYDQKYIKALKKKMYWVDHFINIGDLSKLSEIVSGKSMKAKYEKAPQNYFSDICAYVPISTGCDNFCSYCIVPYARGKEVHRELKDILADVRILVKKGYKLVTLLGQNVNSWKGRDGTKKVGFPYLLKKVSRIHGDFWLTFLTSHPKDFTEKLAEVMASSNKICPYLNLPIQSASNNVLKRMNRNYTWMDYAMKLEYLREVIPDIRLSTDVIVGFPGETKADFEDTLAFVKKVKYGMIYVNEYSEREGTAGAKLKDDVTKAEKKRRKKKVEDSQRKIMNKENREMIGQTVEVLVLKRDFGKTKDLREVNIKNGGKKYVGRFFKAQVVGASAGGLEVKIKV